MSYPERPVRHTERYVRKKVYERGSAEVIVDTDTYVSKDLM